MRTDNSNACQSSKVIKGVCWTIEKPVGMDPKMPEHVLLQLLPLLLQSRHYRYTGRWGSKCAAHNSDKAAANAISKLHLPQHQRQSDKHVYVYPSIANLKNNNKEAIV